MAKTEFSGEVRCRSLWPRVYKCAPVYAATVWLFVCIAPRIALCLAIISQSGENGRSLNFAWLPKRV